MVAACLGSWLGFANPVFHAPVLCLLLPLGAAGIGLTAETPGRAFRLGWLAGLLAYGGSLYWVALPVHDYGYLPWWLAAPCPVALGSYCGLYAGLFALGTHLGRRLPWPGLALAAGALWACLEMLRAWLFTGFPWLMLASAFSPWPFAIQGAALVGAEALSGFYAGLSVLALRGPRARCLALACLALAWGLGLAWAQARVPIRQSLSVSIVQGNVDQSLKWDQAFQEGTVDRYAAMTRTEVARRRPDLAVWPETAMPFYLQEPGLDSSRVRALARDQGLALVTGAPAYAYGPDGRVRLSNRAWLIGPDGEFAGAYDKEHLVPFGEYVPLGEYLPFIGKLITAAGDFVAGSDPAPLRLGPLAAGMLICYETIFPGQAQDRVSDGANLLVNISNDAWFGRSSAPLQHLHLSVLRAVEQGRFLVRSTNTGISAVIDPRGRILVQGGLFKAQTLNWPKVGLIPTLTPYHCFRAWIMAACWALVAAAAAWRLARRESGALRS